MEQKQLKFTIKIYGEGFTEWFYFDYLRVNNKFKFTVEPDLPNGSKSSYKKRLKLIDKELKKNIQERANAIFLITDLDNIICDKKKIDEYKNRKKEYKQKGVLFIENHPCIELWFLYHFWDKFDKTSFRTYDEVKSILRKNLPLYEKTENYYRKNKQFKEVIMQSMDNRKNAVMNGIKSCRYEAEELEICNYSEMFKALHFFRLLKKFCELDSIIKEKRREQIDLSIDIKSHKSIKISYKECDICIFKYDKNGFLNLIVNGTNYNIQDDIPLSDSEEYINDILREISKICETNKNSKLPKLAY